MVYLHSVLDYIGLNVSYTSAGFLVVQRGSFSAYDVICFIEQFFKVLWLLKAIRNSVPLVGSYYEAMVCHLLRCIVQVERIRRYIRSYCLELSFSVVLFRMNSDPSYSEWNRKYIVFTIVFSILRKKRTKVFCIESLFVWMIWTDKLKISSRRTSYYNHTYRFSL